MNYEDEKSETTYEDSLYYLSLLHPQKTSLKLEGFIEDYGIRDHEIHRGYEDALDLLKVIILATVRIKNEALNHRTMIELFNNYGSTIGGMESFFT